MAQDFERDKARNVGTTASTLRTANSDDAIVESFNTFATVEPGEPRHSGLTMHYGSLWWKWTSPVNGNIFIAIMI